MNLVKTDDLVPLLICSTDDELSDLVDWLKQHGEDGLPAALARIRVAADYRLAYDSRHIGRALARLTWEWKPEKRKRGTLYGLLVARFPKVRSAGAAASQGQEPS